MYKNKLVFWQGLLSFTKKQKILAIYNFRTAHLKNTSKVHVCYLKKRDIRSEANGQGNGL